MLALVPVFVLVMWLLYGFADEAVITSQAYYVQMVMTMLTIIVIPLLLKYVSHQRCGAAYGALCLVRMALLMAVAVANVALYYVLCPTPSFYYLGVIAWIAMFFAFPIKETTNDDTHSA